MSGGQSGIDNDDEEMEDLLSQASNRTATGEFQILATIVKLMKGMGIEWSTELSNDILKGNQPLPIVPDSRVSLLLTTDTQLG